MQSKYAERLNGKKQKRDLTLQETHFSFEDNYRLKVKEWKKYAGNNVGKD